MKFKALSIVLLSLSLSACAVVEPYNRPELPVVDAWEATADDGVAAVASEFPWQAYFTDTKLQRVITLALENNRDLRIALLNVQQSQALYRIQAAEITPSVGAMAAADDYRVPEKLSSTGSAYTYESYSVNVGISSWEIDLFGRLRNLKSAALEQYLATEQTARAAQSSLVSAVAAAYLNLAADQELLGLARSTLETQENSHDLIRQSHELGVASALALSQSRSQVEEARAVVAAYTGRIAVDKNALALLVGAGIDPALLPDGLTGLTEISDISPGLPSDVLLSRPDILAAEHSLKAASANIGAARAAFFPRISLTTGIGTASGDLLDLFQSGTGMWSFQPEIVAPLFSGGSLKANLEVAQVQQEIAVAQYEQAIQSAFADVSDALALRETLVDQRTAQTALVEALSDAHRLSEARYRAGVDSYLDVLVSQQTLFSARRALIGARLSEILNRVTLYNVLGGGV
jgi:multidrug efflux system outer membrane protein